MFAPPHSCLNTATVFEVSKLEFIYLFIYLFFTSRVNSLLLYFVAQIVVIVQFLNTSVQFGYSVLNSAGLKFGGMLNKG